MTFPTEENAMGSAIIIDTLRLLVSSTRPRVILEIGMGKTTESLLAFLASMEAKISNLADENTRLPEHAGGDLVDPLWHAETPLKYLGIDAGNGEGSFYPQLKEKIDSYPFANVLNNDYKEVLPLLDENYDLIIVDIGRPSDNLMLLNSLIPKIRPGGLLIMHEPLEIHPFSVDGKRFVQRGYSIAWNLLKAYPSDLFETITLPELHKTAQAGVGILRRKTRYEQIRDPRQLLLELQSCQDIPISNLEYIREMSFSPERKLLDAMRDKSFLQVMALSTLGETAASQISKELDINIKKVLKHLTTLREIGFDSNNESPMERVIEQMRISELPKSSTVLKLTYADYARIADYLFLPHRTYTEETVNWILSHIQTDYAELRRRLVDLGLLTRDNDSQIYWRN
jgi:conserved hypothethical protein